MKGLQFKLELELSDHWSCCFKEAILLRIFMKKFMREKKRQTISECHLFGIPSIV